MRTGGLSFRLSLLGRGGYSFPLSTLRRIRWGERKGGVRGCCSFALLFYCSSALSLCLRLLNSPTRARQLAMTPAAKIPVHSGTNEVKYSRHDSRAAGLFSFLSYLDKLRQQIRPWLLSSRWTCRHLAELGNHQMPLFS